MVTSALELCPPSFTPFEIAIWECSSIIPLVKCFPLASTTVADASDIFFPIAAIFPFLTNTSVSSRIPSFSLVQTVAFLKSIVCISGFFKLP